MKLSFTTLGCPDWTFEQIMQNAQELSFEGLEIRGIENVMRAEEIGRFRPENKRATLEALAERGLTMCGFGTSVSFHNADAYDAAIGEGMRAIEVCQRMGIPFIRVFGDAFPEGEAEESVISRVARGISTLCDYAKDKNVSVYLETHGEFNTVERIQGVIDRVSRDNFAIIWDVAHTDKVYGDDYRAFYTPIKPYIRHLHFKDHLRDEKFTLTRIGMGDIPFKSIARMLRDDGYTGYISLEWEKKWHPELPDGGIANQDYVNLMRDI